MKFLQLSCRLWGLLNVRASLPRQQFKITGPAGFAVTSCASSAGTPGRTTRLLQALCKICEEVLCPLYADSDTNETL